MRSLGWGRCGCDQRERRGCATRRPTGGGGGTRESRETDESLWRTFRDRGEAPGDSRASASARGLADQREAVGAVGGGVAVSASARAGDVAPDGTASKAAFRRPDRPKQRRIRNTVFRYATVSNGATHATKTNHPFGAISSEHAY